MRHATLSMVVFLTTALAGAPAFGSGSGVSVLDGYVGSARQYLDAEGARTTVRVEAEPADEVDVSGPSESRPARHVSPKRAFFLSLLVPGLGEFYAGNPTRAAIFLGVEAAAWTAWSVYRGKGNDARDVYIAFQEAHWSFDRYDAYRHAVWAHAAQETDIFNPDTRSLQSRQQDSLSVLVGTHHYDDCCGQPMPSDDDRYEMIGKYFRFSYGWDDATVYDDSSTLLSESGYFPDPGAAEWGTVTADWTSARGGDFVNVAVDSTGYQVQNLNLVLSANREEYTQLRADANDHFGTAKKFTTVILFNHIISAIHAARLAKKVNETGVFEAPTTSLRMELLPTQKDLVPMLVVRRRF